MERDLSTRNECVSHSSSLSIYNVKLFILPYPHTLIYEVHQKWGEQIFVFSRKVNFTRISSYKE